MLYHAVLQQKARALGRELLALVFPARCPGCDEILMPGISVCPACKESIKRMQEPVCMKCGKPVQKESREYCPDCKKKQHFFSQGRAVFLYEGKIRKSLYRFKYGGRQEYASFYAKEGAALYADWIRRRQIEAIVPIPMYAGKKKRRGYDQAEVFAEYLGRRLQLPVEKRLLYRVRDTTPQKELNERERKHNLKNAFQLRANIVKYNIILLVDDIYTTGSTMDAAAKIFLEAGVSEIYFICISIGAGY